MDGMAQQRLKGVVAPVNFMLPMAEKPYSYNYDPPPGVAPRNTENVEHGITVHDARAVEAGLSLDREGFVLVHHKTAASDLYDEKIITQIYYPECERLMKEATGAAKVVAFDHIVRNAAKATPRRTSHWRKAAAASIAIAAVAIIVSFGLSLAHANNQNAQLQGAIGETAHTAVVAALETPGHKLVTLRDASHRELAQFVVLPDGRGYLVSSLLPTLASKQTYQLWGVVSGQPISLGLLGRSPKQVTFTLAGSPRPSQLGINVEPAGGSVVPSAAMLVEGTV